jgi:GWxTD domain-containing protein
MNRSVRRGTLAAVLLALIMSQAFSFPAQASSAPGAPAGAEYKKWLEEEVAYIITQREREVFLGLKTDREREIFIEAFWKQRDPDPKTPRNEFREEHYRRLAYSDEMFGRDTPRPGRKTDRGRVYIILGPPATIEYFEDIMGVYPAQIWHYFGDPKDGLPVEFKVIFFRKEGSGEYILYSPADHGPQALVQEYMANARDAREAYSKLAELAPNLARESLTLIPGERISPGFPSLASNRLIATVFGLPQKRVVDDYAEAIRRFKDFVEVDYTANYFQSDASLAVFRDPDGFSFVHYSVEPKKLTFEESGSGFTARFELNGRVTDAGGRTIFQFDREMPVSVSREELADISSKTVALQDLFPLIPGDYTFDLLVKDTVARAFTSFSSTVRVPAAVDKGPVLTPLLLAYGREPKAEGEGKAPFLLGGGQLLNQSRKTFTAGDSLVVFFQVLGIEEKARTGAKVRLAVLGEGGPALGKRVDLEGRKGAVIEVTEVLPLNTLTPGYYEVAAELIDAADRVIDSRKEIFELSPVASVPRPVIVSRVWSGPVREETLYLYGLEFLAAGYQDRAADNLSQAFRAAPSRLDFAVGYARAMFAKGDFRAVTEALAAWARDPEAPADILSLLGRANHALDKFAEAAGCYEAYLARFGANVEVLNLLGTCYLRTGRKEEALRAWRKSLELNPDQPKIKALVDSLVR